MLKRGSEAPQVAVWISSESEKQYGVLEQQQQIEKFILVLCDCILIQPFCCLLKGGINTVKHQTPYMCRYQILRLIEKLQLALTVKNETET